MPFTSPEAAAPPPGQLQAPGYSQRALSAEYELILMLDPEVPDERREEIAGNAKQRIESDGSLRHSDTWGVRKLAYEVKKRNEADYRFYRFESEPALLNDLDHTLKITDGILRFRLFKVDPRSPLIEPPAATSLGIGGGRKDDRPRGRGPRRDDDRPAAEEAPAAAAAAEAPAPAAETTPAAPEAPVAPETPVEPAPEEAPAPAPEEAPAPAPEEAPAPAEPAPAPPEEPPAAAEGEAPAEAEAPAEPEST